MTPPLAPPAPPTPPASGASRGFLAAVRRGFIAYARWLASISWKRFTLLSILALIVSALLSELPPFSLRWGPDRTEIRGMPGLSDEEVPLVIEAAKRHKRYEISVDEQGVHIRPIAPGSPAASSPKAAARNGSPPASDGQDSSDDEEAPPQPPLPTAPPVPPVPPTPPVKGPGVEISPDSGVTIRLPADADKQEVKRAIEKAKSDIVAAIRASRPKVRVIKAFSLGDHLVDFTVVFIFMSVIIKIMAAGRFKAERSAVQAAEFAEAEALKRQVVEARMAAMQAQVEPHFLFNTLASIDHLIETDPPRASRMQKNLIALLRASMPTMREANAKGSRDLGRELAVIRPYLEILKVRMEERLHTEIRVPDGLLSADFPPMMLQSLVENAIKHGLEPKPDGGRLTVSAEIVHGKLAVTVADTGLGFGKAATAGTGIGLNNIRERLQLLYGGKASLAVNENQGGGTAVTITVPYTTHHPDGADA